MLKEEAAIREEKAAVREERVRADALAREELHMRSQAEADERNMAREKAQAEIKLKNKQFKRQASNELQQQKLEMDMKMQIAQMWGLATPHGHLS